MLSLKWRHFALFSILHYCSGQRRITDGHEVTTPKRYMVYLASAKTIHSAGFTWICGGAIVNEWFVLTAAACIEDIELAYVIAGYDKYINVSQIDKDPCTKEARRMIVVTYLPISYELDHRNIDHWAKLDIALVKVDKPYHIDDTVFQRHCSYPPARIAINLDLENEVAGTDAIVLGWGHTHKWRKEEEKADLNAKTLRYASTTIISGEECKTYFPKSNLIEIIDNYMICTLGKGELDDKGRVYGKQVRLRHIMRRSGNLSTDSPVQEESNAKTIEIIETDMINSSLRFAPTRRQGICQNDHGGPLVTWINGEETVIGVASVFRINDKSECVPPSLHTSTARTRSFIECILLGHEDLNNRRRSVCDQPDDSKRRFKILRRHLSWENHTEILDPDKVHMRPQISLNHYQG